MMANLMWKLEMRLYLSRYLCILSWVVISTAVLPSLTQAQKLKNDSFEEAATSDDSSDMAAYWGRWGAWVNRETSWKPTRSGRALLGYHHWRVEGTDETGFYQDIDGTRPNEVYEFRIYVYKDAGTNGDEIELRFEPLGGGEAIVAENYQIDDLPNNTWKKLTVAGFSTKRGLRVAVAIRPEKDEAKEGAIKFDDASFTDK